MTTDGSKAKAPTAAQRITELEARLATAEARIAQLEARPYYNAPYPTYPNTMSKCPFCGVFIGTNQVHHCNPTIQYTTTNSTKTLFDELT